jgi:DNA helicase II / ATP-dependent DNA helicase PcrA
MKRTNEANGAPIFSLTTDQGNIVTSSEALISVVAGAGTGKTAVLVQRIKTLLGRHFNDNKQPPLSLKNFAVVTFTNKASAEMKKRLQTLLYKEWFSAYNEDRDDAKQWRTQVDIVEMIDIGTIHKFCEKLLRTHGLHIGVPINFRIASVAHVLNQTADSIISDVCLKRGITDIPPYKISQQLVSFYNYNAGKGFDFSQHIEKVKENSIEDKNSEWRRIKLTFLEAYQQLVESIEEYKRCENILTADDLIIKTAALVKDEVVGKKIAARYQYIFIDESQDTNASQSEIVSQFSALGIHVFIVGDEKQSIYRFRGADVHSYQISKQKGGYKHYALTGNFRTDSQLLEEINRIFKGVFGEENYQTLEGSKTSNCNMKPCFQHRRPENSGLSKQIEVILKYVEEREYTKACGDKFGYRDVAVLYRGNYDLEQGATGMKQSGVPFQVLGGKGLFKAKEVIDTFLVLQYVAFQEKYFKEALHYTDYFKSVGAEQFDRFLDNVTVASRFENVSHLLEILFKESHIFSYYKNKQLPQSVANLQKLKSLCLEKEKNDIQHLADYVDYLHTMIVTEQEEEEAELFDANETGNAVTLMTIHKAKGLEFPIVIIPHFDKPLIRETKKPKLLYDENKEKIAFYHVKENTKKTLFNHPDLHDEDEDYKDLYQLEETETLAEEKRILYVAMTRAENLLVCCIKDKGGNNRAESWSAWVDRANKKNAV